MAEEMAWYDRYYQFKDSASLIIAEKHTLFRMVGDIQGQDVLDLACGNGFYTRQFKERGAARVVGCDISQDMIRLAREEEEAAPLGIEYTVQDALDMPSIGRFHLATAVHMLGSAESKEQLVHMFRSVHRNLADGGRFVAITVNPDFSLKKSNATKYGMKVLSEAFHQDRCVCEGEFQSQPPLRIQFSRWRRELFGQAIREAGFERFAFYPTEVPEDAIARDGAEYWRDMFDNSIMIGIICTK